MAGSGTRATRLAARLTARLLDYVEAQALGAVTAAHGVHTFPGAETGLIPDVGYYVAAKAALIKDNDTPNPFAPDLAVEVASPSQDAADVAAKARVYLNAGTRLVWVVWPHGPQIDVWRVGDRRGPSAALGRGDALDGEDVIPDFADPLAPSPE